MNFFQLGVIAFFVIIAVFSVLIIGGFIPGIGGSSDSIKPMPVVVWGTFPSSQISLLFGEMNDEENAPYRLSYVEKRPETFSRDLLNALASGDGPDAWFISQDNLYENRDRLFVIPFESFSERVFVDTFADEATLFVKRADSNSNEKGGLYALPIVIDPIVLYSNKDILASAEIPNVPVTWNEFVSASEKITVKDTRGNIILSGAALGEARNVVNAKEILSTLILQTGNKIVNPEDFEVTMDDANLNGPSSGAKAVEFYTSFSNPSKNIYSWNRSLPDSLSMFAQGKLAFYFGYASEYQKIKSKNPHLNFDVSIVPQTLGGPVKTTQGKIYALAVSKLSPNQNSALLAVVDIAKKDLSSFFGLAPARRDLLAKGSTDFVASVFYRSAIMARGWLEPDPAETNSIFNNLIESSATGRARFSEAASVASSELKRAFGK